MLKFFSLIPYQMDIRLIGGWMKIIRFIIYR